MKESEINVMLVDDHHIVRQGMGMLINSQPDMNVSHDADNVADAVTILKQYGSEIDIALIDISLNGSSGFELLKSIRIHQPQLPTLVISMHDEILYAERAIHSGANGYIMKQEASETVISSIRAIMQGELAVSDTIKQRLKTSDANASTILIDKLTASELEVLLLLGQGKTTSDIAKNNNRSIKTIEAHRANIRRKLELPDGNALLMFAIQMQTKVI